MLEISTIVTRNKKETLVRELMDLTGAAKLGEQVMRNMLEVLDDEEATNKLLSIAKPDQLIEMIIPLYVAQFDEETLKALINFYKTPAGVKLIAATPAITQASMLAGMEWANTVAEQL